MQSYTALVAASRCATETVFIESTDFRIAKVAWILQMPKP